MWKNLKRFLQTAMGSTVGVYLGRSLWLWQDYKARPGLYAMAGSPWYLPLLAGALVAAGLLLVEGWGLFLVTWFWRYGAVVLKVGEKPTHWLRQRRGGKGAERHDRKKRRYGVWHGLGRPG